MGQQGSHLEGDLGPDQAQLSTNENSGPQFDSRSRGSRKSKSKPKTKSKTKGDKGASHSLPVVVPKSTFADDGEQAPAIKTRTLPNTYAGKRSSQGEKQKRKNLTLSSAFKKGGGKSKAKTARSRDIDTTIGSDKPTENVTQPSVHSAIPISQCSANVPKTTPDRVTGDGSNNSDHVTSTTVLVGDDRSVQSAKITTVDKSSMEPSPTKNEDRDRIPKDDIRIQVVDTRPKPKNIKDISNGHVTVKGVTTADSSDVPDGMCIESLDDSLETMSDAIKSMEQSVNAMNVSRQQSYPPDSRAKGGGVIHSLDEPLSDSLDRSLGMKETNPKKLSIVVPPRPVSESVQMRSSPPRLGQDVGQRDSKGDKPKGRYDISINNTNACIDILNLIMLPSTGNKYLCYCL